MSHAITIDPMTDYPHWSHKVSCTCGYTVYAISHEQAVEHANDHAAQAPALNWTAEQSEKQGHPGHFDWFRHRHGGHGG